MTTLAPTLPTLYNGPDVYMTTMIQSIQANGSKLTDFSIGSNLRNLLEAWAAAGSQQSLVADQFQRDSHLATATGDALDIKGQDYLVARIAGQPATGTVTITRTASGEAITIPAEWGQLQLPPSSASSTPVTFITTEDAVFGSADLSKTVSAVAVTPGVSGNIAAGTVLYPMNPVDGFSTQSGFTVGSTFTNGVDAETDDAYRARIPITVQGRVNGTRAALQAAALSVPGVVSANVVTPGQTGLGGVIPAGTAEVDYQGSSGLLSAVQSALTNASTADQTINVYAATAARCIINVTVYAKAGTDSAALAAAVYQATFAYVDAVGVGQTAYLSNIIAAIDAVPGVVGVQTPLTDCRLFTEAGGTQHDIAPPLGEYPDIRPADQSTAVTFIG